MPNSNEDGFHENQTDKHDVVQVRTGDASGVLIDNTHGSNSVVSSGDSQVHGNVHDDQHSVQQVKAGGDHVVIVTNANGTNSVIHSADGTVVHINTMHDGWVV